MVTREVRTFPEADAFEYTVRFKNDSAAQLPSLGSIVAKDLRFRGEELLPGLSVVSSV